MTALLPKRRMRWLDQTMRLDTIIDCIVRGTKMAKRSKKLHRQKNLEETNEVQDMMMAEASTIDCDMETYIKMLQNPKDIDDEEDNAFHGDPFVPAEHKARCAKMVEMAI
jgi:hypothetical protein